MTKKRIMTQSLGRNDRDGYNSSGLAIRPKTADAAAIAGLARYTSLPVCPMRPIKFLFVVETAFSPSAKTPM